MKLIKAALMGLALAGLFALPLQEAAARTRCNVTTVNGHVVKRVCTTSRTYRRNYRPHRHHYRSYRPYRRNYYRRYDDRSYRRSYYRRYDNRPYYRSYRHNRFWNDY